MNDLHHVHIQKLYINAFIIRFQLVMFAVMVEVIIEWLYITLMCLLFATEDWIMSIYVRSERNGPFDIKSYFSIAH